MNPQHRCSPSPDPRHPGHCACGERLVSRNPGLEYDLTRAAAHAAKRNADALNDYAHGRAGDGPVRALGTRDFGREALEELADCRNYLVWWITQLQGREDVQAGDAQERIGLALVATVEAFDEVMRARAMLA